MASDALSQDQFSKIASALLGKTQGEIDITDRAKLLAFAEALVNDNSDASGEEDSPIPKKRDPVLARANTEVPVETSDEDSIKNDSDEEEEAALEAMLLKAQESVTVITNASE